MVRLTDNQWKMAKVDYEIHRLSYDEIAEKNNISKSTVSRRAKKESWQQSKVEDLVQKKVNAVKSLHEVELKMEQLAPLEQKSIQVEVNERLTQEGFFINSAIKNQNMANQLLDLPMVDEDGELTGAIDLKILNQHSQITARNKEIALGKNSDTAIQINNNLEPTIIELIAPSIKQ